MGMSQLKQEGKTQIDPVVGPPQSVCSLSLTETTGFPETHRILRPSALTCGVCSSADTVAGPGWTCTLGLSYLPEGQHTLRLGLLPCPTINMTHSLPSSIWANARNLIISARHPWALTSLTHSLGSCMIRIVIALMLSGSQFS